MTGLRLRLGRLLACAAAGLLVGLLGRSATGSDAWFLALPALIALGWLTVADPTQCDRNEGPGR